MPAVPFTLPTSPRTGGHEYVWHCHILEHEEHDMMRPLVVADFTNSVFLPSVFGARSRASRAGGLYARRSKQNRLRWHSSQPVLIQAIARGYVFFLSNLQASRKS